MKEKSFSCSSLGVVGVTPVFVRKMGTKFVARCGIALMGQLMDENSVNKNPFDDNFLDNIVEGIGDTEEEALAKLKKDSNDISISLFA